MAEGQGDTQWCKNCKRDIATSNFLMHEVHCHRNIILCEHCEEPVPKSELDDHFQEYHVPVKCDLCQADVDKEQLQTHKDNDCPKRILRCVYCELEVPQCELQKHLDYCGTRTEMCYKCNTYIMHKDLLQHESTECVSTRSQVKEPSLPTSTANSGPSCVTNRQHGPDYVNSFAMDELSRILNEPPLKSRNMNSNMRRKGNLSSLSRPNNMTSRANASSLRNAPHFSTRNDIQGTSRRRATQADSRTSLNKDSKNSNRERERHQGRGPASVHQYGNNLDRDQLLAMQLDMDMRQADLGVNEAPVVETVSPQQSPGDTVLPCEFCDSVFPCEELIQHQAVCDGHGMVSSSPTDHPRTDDGISIPNNSPRRNAPSTRAQPQILDNLAYLTAHDRLAFADPSELHLNPGLDDDILLPCEFCYALFPEDILIQHQAVCDSSLQRRPSLPRISPSSPTSPRGHSRNIHKTHNQGQRSATRSKPNININPRPEAPKRERNTTGTQQRDPPHHWQLNAPVPHQYDHSSYNGSQPNGLHSKANTAAGPKPRHTTTSRRVPGQWSQSPGAGTARMRPVPGQMLDDHSPEGPVNAERLPGYQSSVLRGRPSYRSSQQNGYHEPAYLAANQHVGITGVNQRRKSKPKLVAPTNAGADFSEEGYNMRVGLPPEHSSGQSQAPTRGGPPSRSRRPTARSRRYPQGDV